MENHSFYIAKQNNDSSPQQVQDDPDTYSVNEWQIWLYKANESIGDQRRRWGLIYSKTLEGVRDQLKTHQETEKKSAEFFKTPFPDPLFTYHNPFGPVAIIDSLKKNSQNFVLRSCGRNEKNEEQKIDKKHGDTTTNDRNEMISPSQNFKKESDNLKILLKGGCTWLELEHKIISVLESVDFKSAKATSQIAETLMEKCQRKYYFAFAKGQADGGYCVAWGRLQRGEVEMTMLVWLNGRFLSNFENPILLEDFNTRDLDLKIISADGGAWNELKDGVISILRFADFEAEGITLKLSAVVTEKFKRKYYFAFSKAEIAGPFSVARGKFQKENSVMHLLVWVNGRKINNLPLADIVPNLL